VNRAKMTQTVCMYSPSVNGGMALYTWELMHALADRRSRAYDFELVTGLDIQKQFQTDAYCIHAVLPTIRHRSEFSNRAAWVTDRLSHYARREWEFLGWLKRRPDIAAVHFQEWTPWLAAHVLRRIRRMGKKVLYTVHNVVPHRYPALLPRSLMNFWVCRALRSCDMLYVHTNRLATTLSEQLAGNHPPIRTVPHGVWTVRDQVEIPTLKQRLAWRKLLFFGMIRRNKGLDLLLRAAVDLPGYSITIAGEPHEADYYRTEIQPLIAKLRAMDIKIDLIDRFVPDEELGKLFASHSAVVLPYTRSFVAQSGVIFLSLAYGLPVIASEAGGLPDLFQEFRVGRMFRDQTPQALASAVRELFSREARSDLADQMQRARQRYSWRQAAAATIAGYDAVLDRSPLKVELNEDDLALATATH
jgi:glycosyltransferase involved in cell wall biosynthesis